MATATVKLNNREASKKNFSKEIAFFETSFIEVNQEKMLSHASAEYGVRESGVLSLDGFGYYSRNIDYLVAKHGRLKGNMIYLDGNVTFKEKEGGIYKAEHAVYNQKSEILHIPSSFTAFHNRDIFHGQALEYHAKTKEVNCSQIDAVFYTTKK